MTRPSSPFAPPPPRKRKTVNHCAVCKTAIGPKAQTCIRHHWTLKRAARERPCAYCGKPFSPFPSAMRRSAAKFCSSSCYLSEVGKRPAMIEVICPNCSTKFRRTKAAVRRRKLAFCSQRCSNEFISGERHHAYRGGERHRRGPGWDVGRRACRERDRVCRACGKTPEENGQALSVDHVIPWRLFADEKVANSLTNLIALCRSCHAKKSRAETAYIRGDIQGWMAYLDNVQVDPASLEGLYAYLAPVGKRGEAA